MIFHRLSVRRAARSQKAVILILVLWIVVVLTVIASSLAFDVQVNSKLALLHKNQFLAYNLAKSGVAVGMTNLQNDMLIDYDDNPNQMIDAMSDVWAQPGRRENEVEVKLGKGTYQSEVTDEDGKININSANQRVFKAMLEYYGYEAPDSDDIANAIIDYRDPDDQATGFAGEKENEHYSALLGQKFDLQGNSTEDLVYQCPNENFISIDQLLDVYGITPELYYGYDPDTDEAKSEKIRNDIALGKSSRQPKDRRKKKGLALKDIITVRGSGHVNLNTASKEVLTILIYAGTNFADLNSAQATAESIDNFRGTGRKSRAPDPDDAFHSMADIGKVPGVNLQAFNAAAGMGIQLVFASEVYSVTGIGKVGNVQKTITAIVTRSLDAYNPDDPALVISKNGFGSTRRGFSRRHRGKFTKNGVKTDDYIRIPAIRVQQWLE